MSPAAIPRRNGSLSKSRFCAGLQCLRQLWWRVHEPEAPELRPDAALQQVFARGHRVGDAARAEFPGGVLVDREPWQIAEKLADTRAALDAGAPAIFEASFVADGVFVAVDVLERRGAGHVAIEVKSTYAVKPQFIPDVAIQLHVLRASGLDVPRAEVMHLRRSGRFVRTDVTAAAEALLPSIPGQVRRMTEALSGELPERVPEQRCGEPYECPFVARCRAPA